MEFGWRNIYGDYRAGRRREVGRAKPASGPSQASVTPPFLVHLCLRLCLSIVFIVFFVFYLLKPFFMTFRREI